MHLWTNLLPSKWYTNLQKQMNVSFWRNRKLTEVPIHTLRWTLVKVPVTEPWLSTSLPTPNPSPNLSNLWALLLFPIFPFLYSSAILVTWSLASLGPPLLGVSLLPFTLSYFVSLLFFSHYPPQLLPWPGLFSCLCSIWILSGCSLPCMYSKNLICSHT